jgi:hypothetical protein
MAIESVERSHGAICNLRKKRDDVDGHDALRVVIDDAADTTRWKKALFKNI